MFFKQKDIQLIKSSLMDAYHMYCILYELSKTKQNKKNKIKKNKDD